MRRAAWPFMVSVIVVGVLFLAVFPTRTYVGQRHKLAATEQRVQILSGQNERLADRVRTLNTDEEIERLAREQYSLVRPGEEAYAILPAPRKPAPATQRPSKPKDDPGFWGNLLDDITFWS